jgi:hypothetical protein
MIAPGESCSVSLPALEGEAPLMITAEVVHSFFSMAGVKFVAFAEGAQRGLYQLLQRLTTDPERLAQEWEQLHSAEPALTLPFT